MADSTSAAALPAGVDLWAVYLDGTYDDYKAAWERPDRPRLVPISVNPLHDLGTVGDGPPDNGTWPAWVAWTKRRRAAGIDPTMYTDLGGWGAAKLAFAHAGVAEPHWWIAHWVGTPPAALPNGAVAVQYAHPGGGSPGDYDLSVVADYWPGVDPPRPETTTTTITVVGGHVTIVRAPPATG